MESICGRLASHFSASSWAWFLGPAVIRFGGEIVGPKTDNSRPSDDASTKQEVDSRLAKKNGGVSEPEHRLPPTIM
jgi:hypothetical protein